MKKMMKMVKGALALALVALVGTAEAVTEMKFSGQTSWSTQTLSYYNGDGDGNRGVAGWYYGVTITWPGSGTSWGSSQGNAKHVLTRNGKKIFDNYGDKLSNGSGLTGDTFVGAMHHTYWQAWITPEEAYAANGGDFVQTLVLSGKNGVQSKYTGYSVPETTFTITIPTAGLTLEREGVKWFPAVALIGEKVYGDLNVAIKTWGTVNCVADGAITEAITVAQDSTLVLNKGAHTITGLDNLTIKGGVYDFDPSAYVAKGYKAYQDGNVWRIKLDHQHKWTYATSTDGNVVTLTATCTNPDCTINPPTTSATLTLSSGDKTYDGQAITATLAKNDFETQTGITLGAVECTGNATDVGTYKFSVSAEGTGCDFSKSVTISQLDITSCATIKLSATDLKYTGAEQTVTIDSVKVGNLDVTYDEDGDSMRTEKAIGTYTVKITGKGNFTGKASRNWTISNYSGQLKSVAAAVSGLGTVDGTALTVTDSSKLEYDAENQVWYAGLTLTWYTETGNSYTTVDPDRGYAIFTKPELAQMTVGETTFTGAQSGAYADGKVDNATDTLKYSKNLYNEKTCTYLKTTTWRVKLTPEIIEAAKSAGAITGTMYAGALSFSESDNTQRSPGIEFKNYTITVPIDENLKLYDEVGNQVYPDAGYVAQVAETKLKYLTLDAALKAATAGQTVNALAACEQADFDIGANVTLNLGGFGAEGATYEFVDVTDLNMGAKVVSTKAETVTTAVTGFAVKNDNNIYTLYRSHFHLWEFALNGATLTANCTNTTTDCDLPGRKTSIELTVTGGSDGVAPTFAIDNQEAFLASVNKFASIASIGSISTERLTDDGAAKDKWYVGDYRATCDVEIAGEGTLTLTNEFSIAKPEGGYAKNGWIAGSRDVRYDSWEESLAAASDGDTVYYKGDDRNYKTHEFSIGAKNLTLDFGGKTLKYTNGTEDMTLKNAGTGTLTFQKVTIQQPKYAGISHQISAVGNIQFGTGVKATNQADNPNRYLKITASDGTLTVTNGQYECSYAGTYKLRGGQYKSTYGEPTADTAAGYIVRTITGDYDRDIVYHEHHIAYSAEGNVISATCDAQDHEFCGYGTKTATLNAPDKQEDGQPYDLASIVYSDGFPEQTGVITYWNGDAEIDPPSTFGSYTAKTTIGGATAVKAFQVIHNHNFEYDADQDAGTITARCTVSESCDFNVNKRIATLTAQNGTYTGFGQDLAATATNTGDFPTNVVLTYSCEGKPTNVGDYTATMTVADKSVTKEFSIEKASMSKVAITLSGTSMDYTGGNQSVSIGSVKLGEYTLVEGTDYTVDESSVFSSAGSGAADTTSTIKIIGKGNFAEDAQTATWTIVAPTRDFKGFSIPGDYAGTLSGTTVTMAGADWKYCAAGTAPDGNPNAGWYTCLQIDWPVANAQFTRPEAALHTLSTNPGEQFWGSALPENGNVLTVDADTALFSEIKYVNYTWWHVRMTPEIAEACTEEAFTRSMTACGLKWSSTVYGDKEGVREVTCTVTQPMTETVVLTVPMGATYDLGTNKLAKSALKLAKNASVTTTVEQVEGKIFTEEDGYSVYCIKDGDVFKYVCWLATHYVTVPDVEHATKVVKVGETVKEPTEAGGNVYAVFHGDTVTIVYTPEAGYETADGTKTIANVTGDTTLEDLPTVTATNYAITYELDGGVNNEANPTNYTIESETITLADPTKTDYNFTGWTPEGVIAKGSTGDKAFTATWKLAVVEFTVAAPANASVAKVATNGVEMVAPYKVLPGTAVTVSYKADAGYLFANGTNTMDAEITVNAAGEQPAPKGTETTEGAAKIGTTYYLTLADAVDALKDGETVTLVAAQTADGLTVTNMNVTLDLNGQTLTVAKAATFTANGDIKIVNANATAGGLVIDGIVAVNGSLDINTLSDTTGGLVPGHAGSLTIGAEGSVKLMGAWSVYSANQLANFRTTFFKDTATGAEVVTGKTYTWNGEMFDVENAVANATTALCLDSFDSLSNAVAAVKNNGTVKLVADTTTTAWIRFNENYNVTLDMNGKTISSASDECLVMGLATATQLGTGTLTITGDGSIIQTADREDCDVVWARYGNVVISNGYFEVNGWCQCVYSTNRSQVDIYGGTFKNVTTKTESNYGDVLNVNNKSGVTTDIQCYAGSYSKDPAFGDDAMGPTFVAPGYASYKDGELWTVKAAMPKATVAENPLAAALGGLDAAYTFTTNGVCPAQPVASKNVDYVVTFDNDVEAGAIRLAAVMKNGWTNFPAMKFTAGTPYALVYSMGKTLSVAEMYAMGSFTCGISNISVKTETKMTVQLVMADTVPYVVTNVTYTITPKGPTVIDPIGGDPEETPEIKPVEGTNGVYYIEVKTNTTTAVEIDGLKEDDTVIVPPQINAVNGTESSPISSNQVKVVANATNGTETVVVDITPAFTIKEEDNGVLIELNSNAVVTVKIEGKEPEEIPVTPELTESEDPVKPLVIDETKVATGVKTIPGLKYSLLSGDTPTKIETLVKTIVAEDTRVVLEAAKTDDPSKFYKIQVAK